MKREKWFPVIYLIASVILFLLLIGSMAWHYFHEHHIHRGNSIEQHLNHLDDEQRFCASIANRVDAVTSKEGEHGASR